MNKSTYDTKYLDGYREKLTGYEKARYTAIKDVIQNVTKNDKDNLNILDYGSGNGLFVSLIKECFPNSNHYFCDLSQVALEQLIKKYPQYKKNTSIVYKDNTNYPNNYFDIIVSIEVMEHVTNLRLYLKEIHRLLKTGGIFIWTTPCANPYSIEYIYSLLTNQIEKGKDDCIRWTWEDPTHLRRLRSAKINEILLEMGFNSVNFKFRSHFFSFIFSKLMFRPIKNFSEEMMKFDYILFKNLPNGASMIGYAKK